MDKVKLKSLESSYNKEALYDLSEAIKIVKMHQVLSLMSQLT